MSLFPRLSPNGLSVITQGPRRYGPCWLDDAAYVSYVGNGPGIQTSAGQFYPWPEPDMLTAGGGLFAANYWGQDGLQGIRLSSGLRVAGAFHGALSDTGRLVYLTGHDVHTQTLQDIQGAAYDSGAALEYPRACRSGVAWSRYTPSQVHETHWAEWGRPKVRVHASGALTEFRPVPVWTPSGIWIAAYTHLDVRLYEVGSTRGYILPSVDARALDAKWNGSGIRLVWNGPQGQLYDEVVSLAGPMVPLDAPVTPPVDPPVDPPVEPPIDPPIEPPVVIPPPVQPPGTPMSTLTLRAHDGHFVCAEPDGRIVANRTAAASWETFTITPGVEGRSGLKSAHGKYLCAEGGGGSTLLANRTAVGPWESFKIRQVALGVALETWNGHFVCAEGGGGREVVANRTAIGPWETFATGSGGGGGGGTARTGIVRGNTFQYVDDTGGWLPWGTSLFWATYGYLHERERIDAHLKWISSKGADYVRVMATGLRMGGQERSVSPRDPKFQEAIAGLTALAASYGLRVQWTIFGATYDAPTATERASAVDAVCEALHGHESSVFYVEVGNEAWQNGFEGDTGRDELTSLASRLRDRLPNLVATTSPQIGDDVTPEAVQYYYNGTRATIQTHHYSRATNPPDGHWRPVRKPWRESNFHVSGCCDLVCNQEPIGPNSSGSSDTDPLALAMAAATTWLCGVGAYTLHCGAGIYGVPNRDRPANLWDTQNIDAICQGIQTVRRLLPVDLPNWTKYQTNQGPFRFVDTPDEQLTGAYSASDGPRIVQLPIGVVQPITFSAASARGKVYHPITGEVLEEFTNTYHVSPALPAVVMIAERV